MTIMSVDDVDWNMIVKFDSLYNDKVYRILSMWVVLILGDVDAEIAVALKTVHSSVLVVFMDCNFKSLP